MQLFAVRHGETEWNKAGKQQGHLNSDLTKLGLLQARAMAHGLSGYKIDYMYTSDLGRALQTADIISNVLKLEYVTEPSLRERNLGILQGLTMQEFKIRFPADAEKFAGRDPDYVIPLGESVRQRYERSINFINELTEKYPAANVLVVCHGGVLTSFMQSALDLPLEQKRKYSLYNGSINRFTVTETGGWQLDTWGELSHLREFNLGTLDDF